jgi:polyhydroxybutyrate depolymerase
MANCSGSTLTSGDENRTVDVGGTMRTFILHVPASYDGTTPVPFVMDFHGLGGNGAQQENSSGYKGKSDQEGFVVAFPDGIDNAWNIGPCCTNSGDVDDLGFARAMVESVAADGCIDTKRVYSTGFSMGGGMSHYLACNGADFIAAATPASFDLLVDPEQPCEPSRPIPVLAFRGTADTVVPFDGGPGSSGRITFAGAQATFERWAGIDGCTGSPTSDGDCSIYEDCSDGVEVGLCVIQGGSHAPGDATRGWQFLSQFSLP